MRIGGGVSTIRQFLQARLIDELHLVVRPQLIGKGESLFADVDMPALGYHCSAFTHGERALHVTIEKQ